MGDGVTADDPLPQKKRTMSEAFDDCFPFYLSIGMSSSEYWDGDSSLPRYFRRAFKMKQERDNELAWLNGLYVYDALMSSLSNFDQNKNNRKTYAKKPYSFDKEELKKENDDKVKEAQAQAEVWMKSWASATKKMFEHK